MLDPI